MATGTRKTAHPAKRPTVGARIIEGLEQAIAWTKGESDRVPTAATYRRYAS
jgi:hypothetical protein